MKMKKKHILSALFISLALTCTACADNPETSVVVNKSLDNMIEKAQSSEEEEGGNVSYQDVAQEVSDNAEEYKTEIEDDTLNVKVNVDASVVIPDATNLSIMRVSQKEISQEFLDKVREALAPGVTFYDGSTLDIDTKQDIAAELQHIKQQIEDIKNDDFLSEDDKLSYIEEYQANIEELEEEYESAPEHVDITDYVSDGKIHSVEEMHNSNPDDPYYSWQYDATADSQVYYGINDGEGGNYISMYLQNNSDYGNCLRFEKSRNGYVFASSIYVEGEIEDYTSEADIKTYYDNIVELDNEENTITESAARKKADEFMENIGLTDYVYNTGGLYYQYMNINGEAQFTYEENTAHYRKVYEFLYMRNIDGVFVDNTAGGKDIGEWQGDTYVRKIWNSEAVIIAVNDSGIVSFRYLTPLSVDETVVDSANIKSFDEIKKIFEEMVVIKSADNPQLEDGKTATVNIDNIRLVYARISEEDSFDTGLLVPIWDFQGTVKGPGYTIVDGSVISINAIDGSVVDWSLGY
jgi:hypothetical protein